MFWGLVLEPSKKYTQKVDQTFHISQAALDLKSCDHSEPIQLVVEYENSSFVLATLSKKANIFQVPLDLIFKTGDQVSFRTIGNGKVHLSGYHVLEDIDSIIMNGEEESDLDEIKETDKGKGKRKKSTPKSKGGKKAKLENFNEDGSEEDDDFDEEDSEDIEEENLSLTKKSPKKKKSLDSSLGSLDDEDEDDDDDDFDEEDEDLDDDDDDEDDDDDIEMDEELEDEESDFDSSDENEKSKNNVKGKSPKAAAAGAKSPQTPNGLSSSKKGKDKSAQKGKQGTPGKDNKTPKSETKQKGEKNLKSSAESTPQKKNEEKAPKSPKAEGSPQKKVLEGGVISEDIKVGNGPVAKPGKLVNVYYVGTLPASKKPFDSVQSGAGFRFRVGRNEVIKGWDIGIIGMKVGGKRKLIIPSHLAYGAKGSPPVIPPNSTLIFTVELKGIS